MPDPKNTNKLHVATYSVTYKSSGGFEPVDRTIERFNWNPFRPVECVGGKVWFGTYYECRVEGKVTLQTPFQYYLKRRDGLVP